jgi:hypothetical protein
MGNDLAKSCSAAAKPVTRRQASSGRDIPGSSVRTLAAIKRRIFDAEGQEESAPINPPGLLILLVLANSFLY